VEPIELCPSRRLFLYMDLSAITGWLEETIIEESSGPMSSAIENVALAWGGTVW
jgi:hypothetical protein